MKMRVADLCCFAVFMATLAARADARSSMSARHGRLANKYKGHIHMKHPSEHIYKSPTRLHALKSSPMNIETPSKKYKRNHRDTHQKYAKKSPKRKIPYKRPFKRRYPLASPVKHAAYISSPHREPLGKNYAEASMQHPREYYKPPRYHTLRHDAYGNPIRAGYKAGDFDSHPGPDDKELYDEFPPHYSESYRDHDIEIVNAVSKESMAFADPPLAYDGPEYHFDKFHADPEREAGLHNNNLMLKLLKKKNMPKKTYNKHRTYLKNMNHVVGGQYAEPPARILPDEEDEFRYGDTVSSATVSSYINYKNSNLAFSPQNLNDVFSISD